MIFSLLSAVLLILIFPRFNLTWLAPVALAPLLIACARESSWKRRFFNGWAAGFVFWFGVCYWIQFVLEVHGGLGRWGGWGDVHSVRGPQGPAHGGVRGAAPDF